MPERLAVWGQLKSSEKVMVLNGSIKALHCVSYFLLLAWWNVTPKLEVALQV